LLVLVPVAFSLLRGRNSGKALPHDRYYLQFCERLAALGFVRMPGETAADYAARVCRAVPSMAAQVREITSLYSDLAYAAQSAPDDPALQRLKRAVASFRPAKVIRFDREPV
jgi:hypothetical protein